MKPVSLTATLTPTVSSDVDAAFSGTLTVDFDKVLHVTKVFLFLHFLVFKFWCSYSTSKVMCLGLTCSAFKCLISHCYIFHLKDKKLIFN